MKSSNVRLYLIIIALLASVWALVPTFQANSLAGERRALTLKIDASRSKWMASRNKADSVSFEKDSLALVQWDSTNGNDYRERQKNFLAHPIKLGLDLQGGIYITMEVDIAALLYESAERSAVDDIFEQVMDSTRRESSNSEEAVLDIFTRNFDKMARPRGKTLVNYYDLGLGQDATDEAVVSKLTKNIEDAVNQAQEIIRQRIDKYGVAEPTIQKTGRRVIVELPGVDNEQEIRGLLQTTARLEFKLVRNNSASVKLFRKIDALLAGKVDDSTKTKSDSTTAQKADTTKKKGDSTVAQKGDSTKKKSDSTVAQKGDSTKKKTDTALAKKADTADTTNDPYAGLSDEEKQKKYQADHPFTYYLQTYFKEDADQDGQQAGGAFLVDEAQIPEGEYNFHTPFEGVTKLKKYLQRPEVRAIIPDSVIIVFSAHAEYGEEPGVKESGLYGVYVLTNETPLTGNVITDASANFDPQNGKPMVIMSMDAEGADRWSDLTEKNLKKRFAIVLDSAVYSAPVVQSKIGGGVSTITGSKDINEANLLSIVLKAGALKAPIKIIEERLVGPSLGEDSIRSGINAVLLAASIVMIFMIMYYSTGGLVADFAVIMNVTMTLAALAAFGATLTLPGIGGLVLTIGMAVDGNILIYERIREELAHGKGLKQSVLLGYQKAFAAIIDTHITTILTGLILYAFGAGPIKGFAITLVMGILATLFTAVFVTKTYYMMMLDRGVTTLKFGQPRQKKRETTPAQA